MSFLALDLVCAPYSTEPATVNGPTRLGGSSTLHPLLHCHRPCWRPQAKIRSKRTGRKGLKISQAVSHYRRPSLIKIRPSRPDPVYSFFSPDVRLPVKRPSQDYLIISVRFRDTFTAALCRAISYFMIDSAVVLLDCMLSWRWVSLIRRSPRLPLSYLQSRCTVPSTARRTCPCLGCSSLFFDDDILGQHLVSEQ